MIHEVTLKAGVLNEINELMNIKLFNVFREEEMKYLIYPIQYLLLYTICICLQFTDTLDLLVRCWSLLHLTFTPIYFTYLSSTIVLFIFKTKTGFKCLVCVHTLGQHR